MARVFVGIGSNIDPAANVRRAVAALARLAESIEVSTVYRTAPIGRPEQDSYCNLVVAIETDTPLAGVRDRLRQIESDLGRRRSGDRYAPRPIDLDVVAWDGPAVAEPDLRVPDPDVYTRAFIAHPLLELSPGLVLPDTGRSIVEVAASLPAPAQALAEFTRDLRHTVAASPKER